MPFSKEMILGSSGQSGVSNFYEYQIEQSARFDFASNSYLFRSSINTATSLKKGTWSYWFK